MKLIAALILVLSVAATARGQLVDGSTIDGGPYYTTDGASCFRWNLGAVGVGDLCECTSNDPSTPVTCEIDFVCEKLHGTFVTYGSASSDPAWQMAFSGGSACDSGGSHSATFSVEVVEDFGDAVDSFALKTVAGCHMTLAMTMHADFITGSPTGSPTTSSPTASPTLRPTQDPTASPSFGPSASPSPAPSASPTTAAPSMSPTTAAPSLSPTVAPSLSPTISPTSATLMAEYEAMPAGQRPSQARNGLTWATICGAVGDDTGGCPEHGHHEWCDPSAPYHDAPKAAGECSSSGLMIRNGRCYTCKPTGPLDTPPAA